MADKEKLPSSLLRPDLYDGFDGTPPGYVNPIARTEHVERLLAARRGTAPLDSEFFRLNVEAGTDTPKREHKG